MKQTLIQIIVAAAALAALAAVVYRAQRDAPAPVGAIESTEPTEPRIQLTHEPAFLPSTKTDAGEGAKPLGLELGGVGKKDANYQQDENTVEAVEVDGADEEDVAEPELEITDEPMFLPTTKAPFLPPHIPEPSGEDE